MTVFAGGEPQKSQYRRFKLRSIGDKPNDYLSMQEVLAGGLLKDLERGG